MNESCYWHHSVRVFALGVVLAALSTGCGIKFDPDPDPKHTETCDFIERTGQISRSPGLRDKPGTTGVAAFKTRSSDVAASDVTEKYICSDTTQSDGYYCCKKSQESGFTLPARRTH